MRVLHLDAGREMRGGQLQLAILHRALAERGVEQSVLARGALRAELGCGEISVPAVWREASRCDLIHAHDARSHLFAAVFGRGRPLVVSRRVAFPAGRGPLDRWKYSRAARYLAVSEHVRARLIEAGVPAERVAVVPDGLPIPTQEPAWRPPAEPPVVLTLDSPDPLKGAALASEACRRAGVELRLTRDLDRHLPEADLFLYLTASEGLGSAAIRAGLAKKPIVASRVGGLPEIVVDGETGLLTGNDPDEAAAAIARFRADHELARRCAEAAYRRAAERFSDAKMADATLEAYRAVLAESRRP